ncbi:MAG: 2-aminoethylphosphonate aminotransferase [Gammaproteobacteria bacterium]|nr:2-aminoethylphosphonate aminotransferase [Gammaproteobacteria bacterium]
MEILLNPGPVNLSERVRKALLKPDLCHREQEFSDLQASIRDGLLKVYDLPASGWASVLLTGSGTAAVEAMVSSCVPAHGKVLILENGVYGERMTRMAETHGIDHLPLHHAWGDEFDLTRLEGELQYHDEITHVAVVHHETTTGRLNDLSAVAHICGRHGVSMLIDGVSSFGAEEILFAEWNIAACAATANKCLHGVPGTSFVILNREIPDQMLGTRPRTLYLDLCTYLEMQDQGGTPFTQSVQTFYALDEALRELADEGGWRNRREVYRQRMHTVRGGLDEAGITALLPDEKTSCVLSAFNLPSNLSYDQLHDHLKANGFVIYAGQGQLSQNIFRIACMGEIPEGAVNRLVQTVSDLVE